MSLVLYTRRCIVLQGSQALSNPHTCLAKQPQRLARLLNLQDVGAVVISNRSVKPCDAGRTASASALPAPCGNRAN